MDKFSRSFRIEPLVNMIFEVPKLIALKKVKLFYLKNQKNCNLDFEEEKWKDCDHDHLHLFNLLEKKWFKKMEILS